MIRPVALAIVLALVGCQSADVQRAQPTLTIPAAWRADVGPASPVEGVWWRNFHDSTLNQYVDQALRYNSDVLIARERVNEYQARAYAADSSLFPSLDASLTGTRARTQSAATGLPIHSTLYKGGLTASYDVDIWGANRSAANAAGASLEAQKAAAAAATSPWRPTRIMPRWRGRICSWRALTSGSRYGRDPRYSPWSRLANVPLSI